MNKEELKKRTKIFAIRTYKFIQSMDDDKNISSLKNQLFKASSSVAANYRAVCRGKSPADFLNKLKVVDEEADESLFWFEFIDSIGIKCDKNELDWLTREANELVSIFSASIKTIKQKQYSNQY